MHKLYYSNACQHCVRLLKEIPTKHNLNMNLICIDNESFPEYITSVPTVEDTENKQIFVGSSVFKWFQEMKNVEPYEFGNSNTNSGFSYISDEGNYYVEPVNFMVVDYITNSTASENLKTLNQPNNRQVSSLESIMNERANDLKNI